MKIPILAHVLQRLPRRMRLSVAMGLVVVTAVLCAWSVRHRDANVPWHRFGGMIGWTQSQMIARIGQPAQSSRKTYRTKRRTRFARRPLAPFPFAR